MYESWLKTGIMMEQVMELTFIPLCVDAEPSPTLGKGEISRPGSGSRTAANRSLTAASYIGRCVVQLSLILLLAVATGGVELLSDKEPRPEWLVLGYKESQVMRLNKFVHGSLDPKLSEIVCSVRDIVVSSEDPAHLEFCIPQARVLTHGFVTVVGVDIAKIQRVIRNQSCRLFGGEAP